MIFEIYKNLMFDYDSFETAFFLKITNNCIVIFQTIKQKKGKNYISPIIVDLKCPAWNFFAIFGELRHIKILIVTIQIRSMCIQSVKDGEQNTYLYSTIVVPLSRVSKSSLFNPNEVSSSSCSNTF